MKILDQLLFKSERISAAIKNIRVVFYHYYFTIISYYFMLWTKLGGSASLVSQTKTFACQLGVFFIYYVIECPPSSTDVLAKTIG